jgi:hypothetical protein
MQNLPLDIDTIVRQVLADLSARGASQMPKPVAKPVVVKAETPDTLRLLDSPVTLASLEGRLDGVREVVISPKAIVTPSVRDLLYRKEIKLALAEVEAVLGNNKSPGNTHGKSATTQKSESATGTPTVWLALHQLKREPETLLGFLQGQLNLARESFSCLVATTDAAAKRLAESDAVRAIIVTNHSASAMVLANRHAAIRAILGDNPDQTSQDAAMVGANLLVLHADRLGAYRMKEVARSFLNETTKLRNKLT